MANAQTQEAGAVSAAVEELRKAIIAADRSKLEKLAADELTYGHSSARLENKAQFVDAIANGTSGFSAIELSDQTVDIVDNVALVRHNFLGTRLKGGDKMKLAILTVWVQRQNQWKMLARQAVKI
jgi:ketosteroid isomerase-like protein